MVSPRPQNASGDRAASSATAMASSNAVPSFLTSAGARLTVTLPKGKDSPLTEMAARTRSRLSLTAALGRPPIIPLEINASTSTG